MIGQSTPELVFIWISILVLRSITPLCLVYLFGCLFFRRGELGERFLSWSWSWWIFGYASLEVCFYFFVYRPRRKSLQQHAPHSPPPLTREQRQALFLRCAEYVSEAAYPLGWFTSPSAMRENVVEWLLWALFSCESIESIEDSNEWKEEIDGYVERIEDLVGHKFEDGRHKSVESMRLTFDEVKMVHRPLVWYAIVGLVDHITAARLSILGFRHYSQKTRFKVFPIRAFTALSNKPATQLFSYWYKPHRAPNKDPIIFIHGIGIGLYPYMLFIQDLIKSEPDVGILLIELLPISMRITSQRMPPRPAILEAIYQTMRSLNIPRATLASHSYGTIISAHIIRQQIQVSLPPPQTTTDVSAPAPTPLSTTTPIITSHLLIDPIPILLHLPDVAYNFLYRTPKRANEWQLWYFASRDPDIANTLGRYFFWSENILWRDDLVGIPTTSPPSPTTTTTVGGVGGDRGCTPVAVVLSGKDQIVRAPAVRKYLTGEDEDGIDGSGSGPGRRWVNDEGSLEVLYYPALDHATVFDKRERWRGLIRVLSRFSGGSRDL